MTKVLAFLNAVFAFLKSEPAITIALANFGVFVAGYFGLHVTGDQLVYFMGAITVALGALNRALVTPNSKVPPATVVNVIHPAPDSSVRASGPASGLMPVVEQTHGATAVSEDASDVAARVMDSPKA